MLHPRDNMILIGPDHEEHQLDTDFTKNTLGVNLFLWTYGLVGECQMDRLGLRNTVMMVRTYTVSCVIMVSLVCTSLSHNIWST